MKKINASSGTSGFTLIELLTVIAIVAILAAVSVTTYVGVQLKAVRSEAYSNLQTIRLLEEQFFAENASYAGPAGNSQEIKALLPGFNPGGNPLDLPDFGLNFIYTIQLNFRITSIDPLSIGPSPTPCFVAEAQGRPGTRVSGPENTFAIDCNNSRNF